ncbi:MAG: hypothetical protein JRH20_11985 [Deltaproteobacteria bacterium]|nr:hypothetical protein [Deltaproteobacteria bacterium]
MNALLKGLVLLGVLGGISYGAYHLFFAKTNAQACDKLSELCGGEARKSAVKRCTGFFEQLESAGGKENIARTRTCILDSRTCPAAVGCMVGAGLNAAGDFLEGIKRS